MDQFDVRGQQLIQPEAKDGMGVATTHFHDAVMTSGIGKRMDFLQRLRIISGSRNRQHTSWRSHSPFVTHRQIELSRNLPQDALSSRLSPFVPLCLPEFITVDLFLRGTGFTQHCQRFELFLGLPLGA